MTTRLAPKLENGRHSSSIFAILRTLLYPVLCVFVRDVGLHCLCARYVGIAARGVALFQFGHAADIEPIGMVGTFRQRERRIVVGKRLVELAELQIGESAIGKDLRNLRRQAAGLGAVVNRLLQLLADNGARPTALAP